MKSERITFLATPEFKANLSRMAAQHEVSVGALIRARFEPGANDNEQAEERELRRLTDELRQALQEANQSLHEGLAAAERALRELRTTHAAPADTEQQRQVA